MYIGPRLFRDHTRAQIKLALIGLRQPCDCNPPGAAVEANRFRPITDSEHLLLIPAFAL